MAHQTEPNIPLANITGQKVYTEPPRHEWTCSNCKHWFDEWIDDSFRKGERIGLCKKPIELGTVRAYENDICTRCDFGCINFEGK